MKVYGGEVNVTEQRPVFTVVNAAEQLCAVDGAGNLTVKGRVTTGDGACTLHCPSSVAALVPVPVPVNAERVEMALWVLGAWLAVGLFWGLTIARFHRRMRQRMDALEYAHKAFIGRAP